MHYCCNTVLMYYIVILSLYIPISDRLDRRLQRAQRSETCSRTFLIPMGHNNRRVQEPPFAEPQITSNIITAQHNNMIQCIVGIAPVNREIPVYYYLAQVYDRDDNSNNNNNTYKLCALQTAASGFCANTCGLSGACSTQTSKRRRIYVSCIII